MIESLQRDVRVPTPFQLLQLISFQSYSQIFITRQVKPDYDLWLFAARYGFYELDHYCRLNPKVFQRIKEVIRDKKRGIKYFVEKGLSLWVLNAVTIQFLDDANSKKRFCTHCISCTECVCAKCQNKYT